MLILINVHPEQKNQQSLNTVLPNLKTQSTKLNAVYQDLQYLQCSG
jgi:hypothetical protein